MKAAKCKGVPKRTSSTVRSRLGIVKQPLILEEFLGKHRQCCVYIILCIDIYIYMYIYTMKMYNIYIYTMKTNIYNIMQKRIQRICLLKGGLEKCKTE